MDNRTIEQIRDNETKLINEIKELENENEHLKETNEEHRKINGDLRKENQKLVKVIEEIKFVFDNPENYFSDGCDCRVIEDIINKLTELKGDNNE